MSSWREVDWAVLEQEVQFSFSTSSGPGGQNVNKTNTKVTMHWNPSTSRALTDQACRVLLQFQELQHRLNDRGQVVIIAQASRSQEQNRADATQRLRELVEEALRPRKRRIRTKPTRASRERRLSAKKSHSQRKGDRRWKKEW